MMNVDFRTTSSVDILAISQMVKNGEVSSRELVEDSIARIEAVNPEINAVITKTYDEAIAASAMPSNDTVFAGVPFLVKDLYCHMAGVRTASGSRLTQNFIPEMDSELMARYRRAGLIPMGKTNVCEFGTLGTTEPRLFGATRNPWNLAHTPGGSSGGSAAAVASGMTLAAHGGDGAGSIRIPASCCGLFGLKPTRGRITLGPLIGEGLGGIVNEHVLTTTVRDSAAILDATKGNAVGDPYASPDNSASFLAACSRPPERLRIAVTVDSLIDTTVHDDCKKAVLHTARICEQLGHELEYVSPSLDFETYKKKYTGFWTMTATKAIHSLAIARGQDAEYLARDVEPFNQYLFSVGNQITAAQYLTDLSWFHTFSRNLAVFQQNFDVWLTPTLGSPPPSLGYFDAEAQGGAKVMDRFMEFLAFTTFANMAGIPAMSIPLYWNSNGLPVGSQFMGRFGDESTLFQLASQLEQAEPWLHRKPPALVSG